MSESPATVHPPQQERSRASFERVIEAATALLAEEGYDGFTLAGVSRRAGVSIGSIYARVRSKDDLFLVIQDRFTASTESESWLDHPERWSECSSDDLVRGIVIELGQGFQRNAPLLRVFMHRGIVDPVVADRSSRSVSELADRVEALLLTCRPEIAHPDPELAVDVAFRIVWGTLAHQIMYAPTFESHREVAWSTLVDELATACAAYLLGARPGD